MVFYSWNNLPKIKNWAYVINLYEFKSIKTNWIDLYVKEITQNIFITLQFNTFQKQFKNLQETKI